MKGPKTFLMFIIFVLFINASLAHFTSARASELQTVRQNYLDLLSSPQRSEILSGLQGIQDEPFEQAIPFVEALLEGNLRRLHTQRSAYPDHQAFIDSQGETILIDGQSNMERPFINNQIRRRSREVLAVLYLNFLNATELAETLEEFKFPIRDWMVPIIEKRIDKDKNLELANRLALILVPYDLSSSSTSKQVRALAMIAKHPSNAHKILLDDWLSSSNLPRSVQENAEDVYFWLKVKLWFYEFLAHGLYGLSLGSILLLAASGLAITFGLMGIINMAHGEMLMIGAYMNYCTQWVLQKSLGIPPDISIFAAFLIAFIVTFSLGLFMERFMIRHLYKRPLESLLLTWGLSLIMVQSVRLLFGAQNVEVVPPTWLQGSISMTNTFALPYNRIFVLVAALIIFALFFVILRYTSLGLKIRAVQQNRAIAGALGIHYTKVDGITFALGSAMAGLGGVCISLVDNVSPELGQNYIVESFMVVVIGGVGNLLGTLVGSLGLGITSKYWEPFIGPVFSQVLVFSLIILYLQRHPEGLFPSKNRYKELSS